MEQIRIREGFQGQKQWVIPRNMLQQWASHPLLQSLVPTDIGYYPTAHYHYRERRKGVDEHILIFCVDGAGWCETGGERHSIKAGDALLIPRGTPHIYGAAQTTPWTIHWVHFIGTEADFFIYHLSENEKVIPVDPQCQKAVIELFKQCYDSFVGGFVLYRLIYCTRILHHLLGQLFFNNSAFSPSQRTSRFHSLESTLTFLHQNIAQKLTLDEMAQHAGLSVSHFSHLFKQQTGHAPVDYFIHLKMQHACGLLSLTSKTIRDIAYEIGYDDPYYFSRIFKRVMHVSPQQYRQSPPA
jgi:AraC family transcriptional regulator, arabinose operon regulatory protein